MRYDNSSLEPSAQVSLKTVNLKICKFSFSVHFSKMSSRRQAKLITSYRIPGFSFFISFRFQCNTCFKYAISCFAKAYRNNFASNFWQVTVCGIHMSKSFTGYHILFLGLISFHKLQPPKHRQRQIVNYVMRIQRFHKLQYHRRFLVFFSIMYPLFNKIQRNFNETVCERTRFAKIYCRQRIFYTLLRAYCFPNNFNLNLVE